jgi:2-(1,2-epoxy-1,2-dihydrophenyl)acetyl-CoA isomerase
MGGGSVSDAKAADGQSATAVAVHQAGLREENRGGVIWFTLDRPERRNALTVELVAALADRITAAAGTARAAVITGAGSAFCAGGDLADLGAVAEEGATVVTEVIYGQFHRLFRAITRAPFPIVAAINGAALGAGLDLALACDLRYAAQGAVLASSWIRVGLVPGMGGAYLLTRAVGATRAHEMVLLGAGVDAAQAAEWGLVNQAVEPSRLVCVVEQVCADLGEQPRGAVAASKAALRRALDAGLEEELETLGATQGGLLTGEEFRSRTARFRPR